MQLTFIVGRKLTMLATLMVMPGGLVLLAAVAFAIVLMRSERGRRLLVPVKRRIPPRVRARARRVMALVSGEKLFLPPRRPLHTA